jgi:integrase
VRAGLLAVEPKAETFGAVTANWIARHVDANGLISAPEIKRLLEAHVLPRWKGREFASIRKSDIAALLDEVEDDHGARQADAVLTIVSSLMHWFAARSDEYAPPVVKGMKRQKSASRTRVLDDYELTAIWKAAEVQDGAFAGILRLCLLTAQRSRKVAAMKWSDLDDGVWMVAQESAREKGTGEALKLPEAARAIIEAQPRFASNEHVFAARGSNRAFSGFGSSKEAFDAKLPAGTKAWSVHDLRRTSRSLLSRAGVLSEHAERVMGHAIGGVEGVYDRYSYFAEKADALKRLAALIDAIVNPRAADVLPMRRTGKRE